MLVTSEIPLRHPLKESVENLVLGELALVGGWAGELLVRDELWCLRLVRALDGYTKVLVLRPELDAVDALRLGIRQVVEAAGLRFSTEAAEPAAGE